MLFEKKIKWHKIFESEEAANNFLESGNVNSITVRNKKICLAHTAEGFFAVNDKCPHNGASLSKGRCTVDGAVVCPVHRYHFDLKTGRSKSGLGSYVQPYPIEIRDGGVFLGMEEIVWTFF
jgi:3-phenylpropionate/trans-cinnamate dioxygenase ferredoxin subunit